MFERFKVERDGSHWYLTYAPAEGFGRARLFKYLAWHDTPEKMEIGAQLFCNTLNAHLPTDPR